MRSRFPFRRFRKSLAFRFLAISALAIAAIVPGRLMEARNARQEAADAGNGAVTRIATAGIERLTDIIDESKTILTITALLPTFATPGTPNCHSVLTPIVAETAWISSLSAINARGVVTCSSSSVAENVTLSDRLYMRSALDQRQFQLSGVVVSRVTKAPTLFASVPVSFPGSGTAALLMAINASWFDDITRQLAHSAAGGFAMIVDEQGNILGRSDKFGGVAPESALTDLIRMDRESARPVLMPDGRTLVFAVRDIPYSKSVLVVGLPQTELSQPILAIEANLVKDLAVAVSIIIFVFWLGLESFVRPVLTLAAAARRMGRGKFDIAIDSGGWASEFQTLAAAVTSASSNLAHRAQADAELKAHLRAQSQEDPLTGLKNRRGLDLYVDFEWRACCRDRTEFAAIAFDIDFFKRFNDTYGHDAGDQALRLVAGIMRDQAGHAGGLAARTGGEEFSVIAPAKSAAEAKAIADAVSLRVTALRIPHDGSPLGWLTISAGIAAATASEAFSSMDVFRAADAALYGAKEAGRNTITVGKVIPRSRAAPPVGDSGEPQRESSQDTGSRMPPAFPSAMLR